MSDYSYTNGDGLARLDVNTPDGDNEPISILDDAIRQIKAYLKDPNAGPLPSKGVTEEKIADEAISPRTLGEVAGDGLAGGEGEVLSVKLDNDTLELDEDGNLSIREVPLEKLGSGITTILGYALLVDEKSQGVNGGSGSAGSFQTREINKIEANEGNIVTLGSNQFTLQPGRYTLHVVATAYGPDLHKLALYRVSPSAGYVYYGMSDYSRSATSGAGNIASNGRTSMTVRLNLLEESTFEIRHYRSSAGTWGTASNISGVPEKYLELEIIKYS